MATRCAVCGARLDLDDNPEYAYLAVYGFDSRGEPLYGVHCDECGEALGLARIDLAAERKKEIN